MPYRDRLTFILCLLLLFIIAPVSAQDKQLSDAKTFADVAAYIQQERSKLDLNTSDQKENARAFAGILLPAGDKLLEIAQNDMEIRSAYNMKLSAFQNQVAAGVEGADQKVEALLEEIATHEKSGIRSYAGQFRFGQFTTKARTAEPSPENYEKLKAELTTWASRDGISLSTIASTGLQLAERNKVPADQFVNELTAYTQSPECPLPEERKKALITTLEGLLRLVAGKDPKLYGKTLDDKDFDWDKLRGKYVLIKFTATWCGPCKMEMPGMLEAYEKYHDKGLEIVSVYIWQREDDPVATVKKFVEEEKLPWIIVSEELSKKAGHPEYREFYGIQGVPTMVLVDKEGKIIMTEARGLPLKRRLAEIFQ